MPKFFHAFLFKLILTVIVSILIGFQLSKIEFRESEYSFRKILGTKNEVEVIDQSLQSQVENFLKEKPGEYSVYIKDLKHDSNRNICLRCEEGFEAASLYKLFLMAAIYEEVIKGKLSLDTEISAKLSHLEDVYGGVDFGYESFTKSEIITYKIREALARVAAISDNFAAIMLAEEIGWAKMQLLAEGIGTKATSIKNPITTSTKDIGLLLDKLYKGEIASLESSEQILDLLTTSKINDRIPAKLPKDLKIAHKTGELSRVRNDAGIVFLGSEPYIIVLMSKNLKGEDDGVENLAEISKIIYEYYSANSE